MQRHERRARHWWHARLLFHAAWERRAFGLTLAMGATGQWNIDQSRAARESLAPATYLGSSYYRIWILALERLLLARALVRAGELKAGHALHAPLPGPRPGSEPQHVCAARVLRADAVAATLARGASTARQPAAAARFVLGQRVRARNLHPPGHTRLPRYVRGHLGRVVQIHGASGWTTEILPGAYRGALIAARGAAVPLDVRVAGVDRVGNLSPAARFIPVR